MDAGGRETQGAVSEGKVRGETPLYCYLIPLNLALSLKGKGGFEIAPGYPFTTFNAHVQRRASCRAPAATGGWA
jgi:hypothetical protein